MDPSADVLEELRDIHLPSLSEGSVVADWAAGCALGLLVAVLVMLLARAVVRRPASRRAAALADLTASRGLQPAERLLAQARILQQLALQLNLRPGDSGEHWSIQLGHRLGSDFFASGQGAGMSEALYRPNSAIDPALLDQELLRLLKRLKG